MSDKKSVTATTDEQIDAWNDAVEAVERDAEEGFVDVDEWGGEVKSGEVLRVVCEAYTGNL